MAGWFIVFLLLLLRPANRCRAGWTLLAPLFAVYVTLAIVERLLNGYLIFHYHQYLCSAFADLLRYLAISLAVLFAIADRLSIPWRFLRFVVVSLFLLLCGNVQVGLNQWPFLDGGKWALIFTVMLLLFLVGHSLVNAVLRWCVRADKFGAWHAGFCLVFGLAPMLALIVIEYSLSRSVQLSSTLEKFRMLAVLTSGICLPYLVLLPFVLLARRSALYRERLARVFGLPAPAAAPETAAHREPAAFGA